MPMREAVANAQNNDSQDPEALFVSACYADEGTTMKRWRPRARGRATRIRKRTCHITIIVSRLPEDALRRRNERVASSGRAGAGTAGRASRRARVARSREAEPHDHDHDHDHDEVVEAEVTDEVGTADEQPIEAVADDSVESDSVESEPVEDSPDDDAADEKKDED